MKYGKLPRSFNPTIPHYSTLLRRGTSIVVPQSAHYADSLPNDLGMMGNDAYGDCAWAAWGHAIQLFSKTSRNVEVTEPDEKILQGYAECTGFDPNTGANDNGTNLQDAIKYMLTTGLPITPAPAPHDRHKIVAAVEVDPRNYHDICRAIYECGGLYVGFVVPKSLDDLLNQQGTAGLNRPWDWTQNDSLTQDGHCVWVSGFDDRSLAFDLISWGLKYKMTWEFWSYCVDEAYAIADQTWIQATGKSILGMSLDELQRQMQSFKQS